MKILVAIDGSPNAQATLEALARRMEWFRAAPELTLIYVHPALPYGVAASWVGKGTVQRYYDEESDQALASARALLDVVATKVSPSDESAASMPSTSLSPRIDATTT
jgi:nucleotide-binding universal stress UspA family protein